jgi:hypothetical protein
MTQYAFEPTTVRMTQGGIEPFFPPTIGEFKLHYLALRPVNITVRLLLAALPSVRHIITYSCSPPSRT